MEPPKRNTVPSRRQVQHHEYELSIRACRSRSRTWTRRPPRLVSTNSATRPAVEIGVESGDTPRCCASSRVHLFSIDPWKAYRGTATRRSAEIDGFYKTTQEMENYRIGQVSGMVRTTLQQSRTSRAAKRAGHEFLRSLKEGNISISLIRKAKYYRFSFLKSILL